MSLLTASFLKKRIIFRLEFNLSFKKTSSSKLGILLITNFDLSENTGKAVTKEGKFLHFFAN